MPHPPLPPDGASTAPSAAASGQQPCCYLCPATATASCAHCQQPTCPVHTTSHREMHWETLWAGGERVASLWTRYAPTDSLLSVCSACGETLAGMDATELAYDRAAVRQRTLIYLVVAAVVIVLTIALGVGLPFLLGH